MKFSIPTYLAAICATATLAGCVVAPVGYEPGYGGPAYTPPPGVVYVAPTYAMPAPGYLWRFHASYGWGWYHPSHGWHRGWR
jgi:hypothetical protein